MKSCILASSNTKEADILALQELAKSRFDYASETIITTRLSIVDIIDKIRAGGFRRVYLQSAAQLSFNSGPSQTPSPQHPEFCPAPQNINTPPPPVGDPPASLGLVVA